MQQQQANGAHVKVQLKHLHTQIFYVCTFELLETRFYFLHLLRGKGLNQCRKGCIMVLCYTSGCDPVKRQSWFVIVRR